MRRRKYDTQQILNFIIEHKKANDGNSPSYREIMDSIGISSLSVVDYLLKKMEKEGLIHMDHNRGIRVPGGEWRIECGGMTETRNEQN